MFSEWSGNILAVAWILAIYFQASGGDALVLYNSSMARLVFLFEDANATYSPNINGTTNGLNAQVRDKTKQTVVDTRYLKHWLSLHALAPRRFNYGLHARNLQYMYTLQVAKSEGLILVYKFEDGILTSSHSQLKHTEINLSPSTISSLEDLVTRYVKDNFEDSLHKEKVSQHNESKSNSLNSIHFILTQHQHRQFMIKCTDLQAHNTIMNV